MVPAIAIDREIIAQLSADDEMTATALVRPDPQHRKVVVGVSNTFTSGVGQRQKGDLQPVAPNPTEERSLDRRHNSSAQV